MPKINQEEYEVLKELDDKWKWIARDENGDLYAFDRGPQKIKWMWFDENGDAGHLYEHESKFRLIQWKDEEPHSIAELIEEYEAQQIISAMAKEGATLEVEKESAEREAKDKETDLYTRRMKYIAQVFSNFNSDSEETEVKSIQDLIDKWESAIGAADFYGKGKEERLISYMKDFVSDLNQLDEPEILSQEWIDGNKEPFHHFETEKVDYYVSADLLQNLLVPKQELPVIPKFVADFIESYDGDFYSLLYDADNISSDASLVTEEYYELGNWLSVNSDELLQAVANGYEVEEEQKYYVLDTEDIPMLLKSYGAVIRANSHLSIHEKARNTEHYQLTEQEIKEYDERFWTFAVKVEGLGE